MNPTGLNRAATRCPPARDCSSPSTVPPFGPTSTPVLHQHYVVAGRIERDGTLAARFAWIALWPGEPQQFMRSALQANGWTTQTKVVVLTDGADGLKNLVKAAVDSETPQYC